MYNTHYTHKHTQTKQQNSQQKIDLRLKLKQSLAKSLKWNVRLLKICFKGVILSQNVSTSITLPT